MSEKMTKKRSGVKSAQPVNPWGSSLDKLKESDPPGAEEIRALLRTNPVVTILVGEFVGPSRRTR
jgi:hypothetical protein